MEDESSKIKINTFGSKIKINTFGSKIQIFRYLFDTDKKWSITSSCIIIAYLTIFLTLTIKAIYTKIKLGYLNSLALSLLNNFVVLLLLLVIAVAVILIYTYKLVGRSLTMYDTTVIFNDSIASLEIEYCDILGKMNISNYDDKIVTDTITYKNIAEIGVIQEYGCVDIHGLIRRVNTDSITSENIKFASSNSSEQVENLVVFVSKEEYNTLINKLSILKTVETLEVKKWYAGQNKN